MPSLRSWPRARSSPSTQSSSEVAAGDVLRYLAELPLVPWAMEHNAELEWRELDDRSVEVAARAAAGGSRSRSSSTLPATSFARAATRDRGRWAGRRCSRRGGGEFGDYRALGGMRIPTRARVYWELDEGRFVYWHGTVTSAVALDEPFGADR